MAWLSETRRRQLRALMERTGIAAFWRWWMGELKPLVPPRLLAWLRPARAGVAMMPDDGGWRVFFHDTTSWHETDRISAESDAGPADLPPALRERLVRQGNKVALVVPTRDLLRRAIQLPLAVQEDLGSAVGFDLDRHTPYKADQVYFGAQITRRDDAQGLCEVDLGVVPRERADRHMARLTGWGLTVVSMVPELVAEPALELLPAERRHQDAGREGWRYWAPAAGIAALAIVVLALPVWKKREVVLALQPQFVEWQQRAEVAEATHRKLINLQNEYNFLLARKHVQPMAIEVLDEVTRVLPDDTWVQSMEVKSDAKNPGKNRELQVRGETGISGKLISVFEDSKLFTQASYKSPVTKGQPGAGDIFHVGAEIRLRPAPSPLEEFAPEVAAVPPKPGVSRPPPGGTPGAPPVPPPAAPAARTAP